MIDKYVDDLKKCFIVPFPGEKAQLNMSPEIRDHLNGFQKKTLVKKAAVAIVLFPKNGILHTVFIKRPKYDGPHSAQISFPGGKLDYGDSNLIQTALRETYEEIGLKPDDLIYLSSITQLYIPISNIVVLPVVFYLPYQPEYSIDKREVEYTIDIDLNMLFDVNSKKEKQLTIGDLTFNTPYYDVDNNHIWGATAMVIAELKEIINNFNLVMPDFYNAQNDRKSL